MSPEAGETLLPLFQTLLEREAQVLVCAGGTDLLNPLTVQFPNQVALMPYSREGVSAVYSSVDIFLTDKGEKTAWAYGAVPVEPSLEAILKALRDYEDEER